MKLRAVIIACLACSWHPVPALAHAQPYSFLDLRMEPSGLRGTLTAHVFDLAHEIGVASPDTLLDASVARHHARALEEQLAPRLVLVADGDTLRPRWTGVTVASERKGLTFAFASPWRHMPGALTIDAELFPYDPQHETYVNTYERGRLRGQDLFDASRHRAFHSTGGVRGTWSVSRTFVLAGIHHIFTGPDHVLFLVALLLLGGGFARLLAIASAFTIAHSCTLAVATLGWASPPAWIVEVGSPGTELEFAL